MSHATFGDRRSLRGTWILIGLLAAYLLGTMAAFCGVRGGVMVVPAMQPRRTTLEALPVLPLLDVPTRAAALVTAGGAFLSAATAAVVWRLMARRRRGLVMPEQKRLPAPPEQKFLHPVTVKRTVVLLGKSGCGKSLLGNVMLGEYDAFESVDSTSSVTKGSEGKEARIVAPDHRPMDLTVYDTQGLMDTDMVIQDEKLLQQHQDIINMTFDLWEATSEGVNVFIYVVKNERIGQLEGLIARSIIKYVFDGAEKEPNLVIAMTHCKKEKVNFSEEEKAAWLEQESLKNVNFKALYEVVNMDPTRLFMVDNQDDTEMYKQNARQIAPLLRYILNTDSTLHWKDAKLMERRAKLKEQIEELEYFSRENTQKRLEQTQEEKNRAEAANERLKEELKKEVKRLEEEAAENTKNRAKEDGSGCFGGLSEVLVRDKGIIKMHDLGVGDVVATGEGWSPVVAWWHRSTDETVEVVEIVTSGGKLLATPEHLLFRADGSTSPASAIQCNDELASEGGKTVLVTSVQLSTSVGYYAPLTQSGQIQVSGVRCSCYVETMGLSHPQMNLFTAPVRSALGWISDLRRDDPLCEVP